MRKTTKSTRRRHGMQVVTLCISTTMVLILLGLVVLSVLTARNLSNYVKENLTVTVMLNDTISDNDARLFCRDLYHRPYSRNIDYISKEQALKEQTAAMGSDPSEFLGMNPFAATLELQLRSDYACHDSLRWIEKELLRSPKVTDVVYQEDLMDKVNKNLQKVNIVLLILALLLTFISYSLISNTVRLGVYSRRFLIHTMKLVGASWSFIRRPFMRDSITVGLLAALLACGVLGGAVYALWQYEPNILNIITTEVLIITGVSVFLFGLFITSLCSYISVNRFLRMTAGELYKI
jgi:cell division transport system permease protein